VLTWHLKTRFPYAINSFTNFSNKNTISSIPGGFTFNVLGFVWVLLGVFGLFRANLGFFGLFRDFLSFLGLLGLSPTVGQQACLRRGARKLSDFISKLSDNPTILGHNCHPAPEYPQLHTVMPSNSRTEP